MDGRRTVGRSKSLEIEPIDDGLIRFHARLDDTSRMFPEDETIHSIAIEGTISLPDLVVRSIEPTVNHQPYAQCAASLTPFPDLVGLRIGPGFREHVLRVMGRTRGCTHFLTLVLDLAAAHTLSLFMRMRQRVPFEARTVQDGAWIAAGLTIEPRLENACVALQADLPVIQAARRNLARKSGGAS